MTPIVVNYGHTGGEGAGVRFGVWDHMPLLDGQAPAALYAEHLDQVAEADRLGYDEYWLAEHHFSPAYSCLPAPHLLLAAAARRTERIRLGVLINVVPFHNPIRLVEEVNVLDQLSDGRAMLGLGRGMRAAEYARFAIPPEEGPERFFEGVDAICQLASGAPTTYAGRWFNCEDVVVAPGPVQRPRVELVMGSSTNPRTAALAARHGMRLAQGLGSDEDLGLALDAFRAGCSDGAAPRLTMMRMTCVRAEAGEARRVAEPALLALLRAFSGDPDPRYAALDDASFRHHSGTAFGGRLGAMTYDQLASSGFVLVGDPAGVAHSIERLRERFGPTCLLAAFGFAGLAHEEVLESMRLFAAEVVPRFGEEEVRVAWG